MLKGDDNQVKFQYPSCENMNERPKKINTLAYAFKSDDGKTNYPISCLCCCKR